jgi:hypothetical protein
LWRDLLFALMERRNLEDLPTPHSLCPKVKQQVPPLRYPGFPVELGGVGEVHAAFLTESRTRGRSAACQEIRVRSGSTARRDRRDDKLEGGGPPWHGQSGMDRYGQQQQVAPSKRPFAG